MAFLDHRILCHGAATQSPGPISRYALFWQVAPLNPVTGGYFRGEVFLCEILEAEIAERLDFSLFFRAQHQFKLAHPQLRRYHQLVIQKEIFQTPEF